MSKKRKRSSQGKRYLLRLFKYFVEKKKMRNSPLDVDNGESHKKKKKKTNLTPMIKRHHTGQSKGRFRDYSLRKILYSQYVKTIEYP